MTLALEISHSVENSGQHPADVGVDDRHSLAIGEGGDRPRGVRADAGQRQQRVHVIGDLAAMQLHERAGAGRRAAAAPGAGSRAGPTPGSRSPAGSAASAAGAGQRRSHDSYTGNTRLTGVCCSMNSLTRTAQGDASGARQGRSRALVSYHSSNASIGSRSPSGAEGVFIA